MKNLFSTYSSDNVGFDVSGGAFSFIGEVTKSDYDTTFQKRLACSS